MHSFDSAFLSYKFYVPKMNVIVLIATLVCLIGCAWGAEQPCDLEALFETLSGYEYARNLDAELANDYRKELSEQHEVCNAEIASLIKETSKKSKESSNLSELTQLINTSKAECADDQSNQNCHYAEGIVNYIENHDGDLSKDFDEEFSKAMVMCKNFTDDYATITKIYKVERDALNLEMSEVAKDILAKAEVCDCINFSSYNRFDMHQKALAIWSNDHSHH